MCHVWTAPSWPALLQRFGVKMGGPVMFDEVIALQSLAAFAQYFTVHYSMS